MLSLKNFSFLFFLFFFFGDRGCMHWEQGELEWQHYPQWDACPQPWQYLVWVATSVWKGWTLMQFPSITGLMPHLRGCETAFLVSCWLSSISTNLFTIFPQILQQMVSGFVFWFNISMCDWRELNFFLQIA